MLPDDPRHAALALPPARTIPIDDDARFSALLATYAPALRRVCTAYTADADEQQDLMQEMAFALWRALPTFRGDCSERTFVYRVAHNRALSHRHRKRLPLAPADAAEALADPASTPDAVAERESERTRLLRAVRALPDAMRHVVLLRLEGLSDREVADVLGISEGNVAVRLTRARQALRSALTTDDSQGPARDEEVR